MKLFWAVLNCIFCTGHISFAEPRLTYNSYGMPGLVDMPSAQSAPDAELSFSISQAGKSLHNTLMFQIAPRLTAAFRYSSIGRPGSTLYDRSFDLRYVIAPRHAGDGPTCLADVRKAKEVLGFETQFGLDDMCQS